MTTWNRISGLVVSVVIIAGGIGMGHAEESLNVELVGRALVEGSSRAAFLQGDYAYLCAGKTLVILDITDPSSPVRVGLHDNRIGAEDVYVSGSYAYVVDSWEGVHILDVSDPTSPVEVGFFKTRPYVKSVYVSGSYAYVINGYYGGLRILDVSDPMSPSEVGFYGTPPGSHEVYVSGSYAYVANKDKGLRVIDVSDPSSPSEVGFYDTHCAYGVYVSGPYAYVADQNDGLRIIDVSDPTSPSEVGVCDTQHWATKVSVSGSYAYVADWGGGLRIIDISDPTSPVETGSYRTPGWGLDVVMRGSYAYLATGWGGLRIYDVSDSTSPLEVGSYDTASLAHEVYVSDSYAYVADGSDGLQILDVSSPSSPLKVGSYDVAGSNLPSPGCAYDVYVLGSYAYVAAGYEGLRILDVSDPSVPSEVGFYDTPGYASLGVYVSGSYAYLADGGGLYIIDVSNPSSPEKVGFYDTEIGVRDVSVSGSYAYLANEIDGLRIIDTSDPTSPLEVGFLDTPGYLLEVQVAGGYAYVVDSYRLRIIDISDPISPLEVAFCDPRGDACGLYVSDSYAYLATDRYGLSIVDISDPSSPTEVGFYETGIDGAYGVYASAPYVYLADWFDGLSIFRFTTLNQPPVANAGGPYTVAEGGSVVVTASGSDPEGDPLTFAWDLDNDGEFDDAAGESATFSAAELDGSSSHMIAVQVTDSGGLSATDQTTVAVANVAPTVGEIAAPLDPVQVDIVVNVSADFTDPGVADTHTAEWTWSDGSTSPGVVNETNGSGTVTGSHTYATPGVYVVTLTVTDDNGDSDDSFFQYVVVYDPADGFVTGGGWIGLPAGAYAGDPSLEGKANFGFVSKYKKGASVPIGETEFSFTVADLNFHSSCYEWLVVAGSRAKYQGEGRINGTGNYGFMLTATDAALTPSTDADLFRIKIWDKDNGDVIVYDNQMDAGDDSYEGTALGGGNIKIHPGSSKPVGDMTPNRIVLEHNTPNPFNPSTTIRFSLPFSSTVRLTVYDLQGQKVATLVQGESREAGRYAVDFDGAGMASGIYLYRLKAGSFRQVKKMTLIK